ncbi:MAG TPA: hypothetical protein VLF94_00575 [Chlamydiales bacterium]|nr:hypothetical protein [Chlamydiales bacterium]
MTPATGASAAASFQSYVRDSSFELAVLEEIASFAPGALFLLPEGMLPPDHLATARQYVWSGIISSRPKVNITDVFRRAAYQGPRELVQAIISSSRFDEITAADLGQMLIGGSRWRWGFRTSSDHYQIQKIQENYSL